MVILAVRISQGYKELRWSWAVFSYRMGCAGYPALPDKPGVYIVPYCPPLRVPWINTKGRRTRDIASSNLPFPSPIFQLDTLPHKLDMLSPRGDRTGQVEAPNWSLYRLIYNTTLYTPGINGKTISGAINAIISSTNIILAHKLSIVKFYRQIENSISSLRKMKKQQPNITKRYLSVWKKKIIDNFM